MDIFQLTVKQCGEDSGADGSDGTQSGIIIHLGSQPSHTHIRDEQVAEL